MKLLKICDGSNSIVDDEDFDRLSKFVWYISSKCRSVIIRHDRSCEITKVITLALEVMNRLGIRFDHFDRDFRNNQKSNLRECSISQNNANREFGYNSTSKYKGIRKKKGRRKFEVYICGEYIGSNNNEDAAALMYNEAALKRFGEFACLNVISPLENKTQNQ